MRLIFSEVKEEGRWVCDRSLRAYMDAQAVMGGELQLQLRRFASLLAAVEASFDSYFAW